MTYNLQKKCFFWAVVLLPLVTIPKQISLPIPGTMWGQASVYPILLGMILWVYEMFKNKRWSIPQTFTCYAGGYIGLILVSIVWGVLQYPYYNMMDITQFGSVRNLFEWLESYGILQGSSLSLVLGTKLVVTTLIDAVMTIGVSFWIYSLYQGDLEGGMDQFRRGLLYSFFFVGAYCVIELFFLGGSTVAKSLLETINPCLYSLKTSHDWWPPLLWDSQVRSVFPEPSFFGLYSVFVAPVLIHYIFTAQAHLWRYYAAFLYLAFLIFMTESRTAILLFLIIVGITGILLIYLKRTKLTVKFLAIVSLLILSSLLASCFPLQSLGTANTTIEQTIVSITKPDVRSNKTRFLVMEGDLQIAFHHPVLGVGSHLARMYFPEYLTDTTPELDLWLQMQNEQGMVSSGIPNLNQITRLAAESGIAVVTLYLVAAFLILRKGLCRLLGAGDERMFSLNLLLFTEFIGALGGLASSPDTVLYAFYLLLGLGLLLIGKQSRES